MRRGNKRMEAGNVNTFCGGGKRYVRRKKEDAKSTGKITNKLMAQ